MFNDFTEHSLEVFNNIRINKSVIKLIFESSDERNKNSDITSIKKSFKLNEHNFKRKTQNKRLNQYACFNYYKHV